MSVATYPTLAMLEMMKKYHALDKESSQAEIDTFRAEYIVTTHLNHRKSLIIILAIFLQHRFLANESLSVAEKMKQLEDLPQKLDEEMKWIAEFYCRLMDRLDSGRYVFYALTKDSAEAEPFDLEERPDNVKFITIESCNACGKSDAVLQLCIKCKKAAYCNQACEKKDWSFHKHYCEFLNNK